MENAQAENGGKARDVDEAQGRKRGRRCYDPCIITYPRTAWKDVGWTSLKQRKLWTEWSRMVIVRRVPLLTQAKRTRWMTTSERQMPPRLPWNDAMIFENFRDLWSLIKKEYHHLRVSFAGVCVNVCVFVCVCKRQTNIKQNTWYHTHNIEIIE